MTATKRRKILFTAGTFAMAFAGTGLTLFNNINVQAFTDDVMLGLMILFIALCLAACFTAMEITFVSAYKELENATRTWRKAFFVTTLVLLGLVGMPYALFEELKVAHSKVTNWSMATNSSMIVKSVDKKNQRGVARDAIKSLKEEKKDVNAFPFILGYGLAALGHIIIAAVGEKKKERRNGQGNLLVNNPVLSQRVQSKYGVDPATARLYADRNGKGAAVWHKSKQIGYLSASELNDVEINKYFSGHNLQRPDKKYLYDPADDRKTLT